MKTTTVQPVLRPHFHVTGTQNRDHSDRPSTPSRRRPRALCAGRIEHVSCYDRRTASFGFGPVTLTPAAVAECRTLARWSRGAIVVLAVLVVMSVGSIRLRDATISNCTAAAWIGTVVGALALTVSSYRWNNQLGCREAFPRHFGYRGPNWEIAPYPVEDERSWWPLEFTCRGVSSYTGEFTSIAPGWGLTVLVYGCFGCAVVAAFIAAGRVSFLLRRHHGAT